MGTISVIQIKIYFNFMIIKGYVIDNQTTKAITQIEQWQCGNAIINIYQDRLDKQHFSRKISLGKSFGALSALEIEGQCRIPKVHLEQVPTFQ